MSILSSKANHITIAISVNIITIRYSNKTSDETCAEIVEVNCAFTLC